MSLARRMVPPAEMDDAVQEIFIDLWKSAARFDPEKAAESTFVAMIARRRLIDRRRRMQSRPTPEQLLEPALAAPETADSVELGQEVGLVFDAMNALSDAQRRVLELSLRHGRSHNEIAEQTGMPLGTVKSHARRGLMLLREKLQHSYSPTGDMS